MKALLNKKSKPVFTPVWKRFVLLFLNFLWSNIKRPHCKLVREKGSRWQNPTQHFWNFLFAHSISISVILTVVSTVVSQVLFGSFFTVEHIPTKSSLSNKKVPVEKESSHSKLFGQLCNSSTWWVTKSQKKYRIPRIVLTIKTFISMQIDHYIFHFFIGGACKLDN